MFYLPLFQYMKSSLALMVPNTHRGSDMQGAGGGGKGPSTGKMGGGVLRPFPPNGIAPGAIRRKAHSL